MKSMAISEFKTFALRVLNTVAKEHQSIIITRRGKPLARVIPFRTTNRKPKAGKLASTLVYEKDIVTPLGKTPWEVLR